MSVEVAMRELEDIASEIRRRSDELAETQRELDAMQTDYDDFLRDFEVDLYEKALEKQEKLPSEKLREALALKAMPSGFRNRYDEAKRKRERLKKRISDLKSSADSQRSVLSAERVVVEGGGG